MGDSDGKYGFLGIWIPASIWQHKSLRVLDRVLWAEIGALAAGAREMGLAGCFKSNAAFAAEYGVSADVISRHIGVLRGLGLVIEVGFDGRRRYLDAIEPVVSEALRELRERDGIAESTETPRQPREKRRGRPDENVEHKENIKEKVKEKVKNKNSVSAKPLSAMLDPLANGFQQAIEQITPYSLWKSIPQERKALNEIAKRTRQAAETFGVDNDLMAKRVLQVYYDTKRTERASYWKDAPFTASGILTRWDAVISKLVGVVELAAEDVDIEELAKRMRDAELRLDG